LRGPIEALQHGVDLLLANGRLEILQGLEPNRFDRSGALEPADPPPGHQLSRTLQIHSAALADQGSQERVFLGGGCRIRLETHQLVGERLEQEHRRWQLRAQGRLQLCCWYCWACAPSALPQQPSCRICRRLPRWERERGAPGQRSRPLP